jgi:hypothetical protein
VQSVQRANVTRLPIGTINCKAFIEKRIYISILPMSELLLERESVPKLSPHSMKFYLFDFISTSQ